MGGDSQAEPPCLREIVYVHCMCHTTWGTRTRSELMRKNKLITMAYDKKEVTGVMIPELL